ncbi:cysteine desulfurase NifS [Candidatus Woesearchaeota archaeon]|nr:cysteine desulfurase NifS [Candidatus Woesearchaeota archaeon]
MKSKEIYLDNGATTKVDPEVIKAILPYFDKEYGNASSAHTLGVNAKNAIDKARETIAESINAKSEEIIFTSGGTESDNLAIQEIAYPNRDKGNHIITTKVEHKAIINTCKFLEKDGFKVTYLDVDKEGFVNPDALEKAITNKTLLVSIIHGNSETGTIQNLEELGKICKKHDVYFHIDACQSYTKTEIDVQKQNLDLVTMSGHKIHGPTGVGALYIKKGTNIHPLMHGGDQELKLRPGTENVSGIVGFAEAVKLADKKYIEYMTKLRDKLIEGVLKIPDVKLNGPKSARLCNNTNFSFKGIEGEAVVGRLDVEGVCSSTGSACSEKSLEPSYILTAIGLSDEEANGSIRLTLSRFTKEEEIDYVLKVLPEVVKTLRKISPFGG